MKRSLLSPGFLIGLCIIMLGAGCENNSTVQKNNIQRIPQEPYAESTNDSVKNFTVAGLTMTVPNKYSVVKVENNKVWIKTDDTQYDVKLILEVQFDGQIDKSNFSDDKPVLVLKNGAVYENHNIADAALPQFFGYVENNGFRFDWDVESNEEAPKDAEIWSPSTKVIEQDLLAILKTIK